MSNNMSYMLDFLHQIKNHPDILSYSKVVLDEKYKASESNFEPIRIGIGSDNRMFANRVVMDLCLFMLLDSLIDKQNPLTGGFDFLTKYKKMKADMPHLFIGRECFRLMRLIRNATIHDDKGLSHEGEIVKIWNDKFDDYIHQDQRIMKINLHSNKKDELLDMYFSGKKYLDFIIWFLVFEQKPKGYSLLVLTNAYYHLKASIRVLSDKIMDGIKDNEIIYPSVKLKGFNRHVMFNSEIRKENDKIIIKIKEYYTDCCDYYWELGSLVYLIPLESLTLRENDLWEIDNEKLNDFEVSELFMSKYLKIK